MPVQAGAGAAILAAAGLPFLIPLAPVLDSFINKLLGGIFGKAPKIISIDYNPAFMDKALRDLQTSRGIFRAVHRLRVLTQLVALLSPNRRYVGPDHFSSASNPDLFRLLGQIEAAVMTTRFNGGGIIPIPLPGPYAPAPPPYAPPLPAPGAPRFGPNGGGGGGGGNGGGAGPCPPGTACNGPSLDVGGVTVCLGSCQPIDGGGGGGGLDPGPGGIPGGPGFGPFPGPGPTGPGPAAPPQGPGTACDSGYTSVTTRTHVLWPVSCPPPDRGYRPNKSAYFLKDGTRIEKASVWVRMRRRNPFNRKANARAGSRIESAKRAQKYLNRFSVRSTCRK